MSEQNVFNFISNLPNAASGVALELGANHGIFTDLIASKFARCIAFEPDFKNMDILKNAVKAKNVSFEQQAIGLTNGTTKLYLCGPNDGGHSTCESHPQFGQWGHSFNNYVVVPSVTLDKFTRGMQIKFIKCDVEGAEKFIFDKGKEMLAVNDLTLLLETHQMVDFAKLYKLFTDLRYKIYYTDNQKPADKFDADLHYIVTNDLVTISKLNPTTDEIDSNQWLNTK